MQTTITSWGNSLAIRLPKPFLHQVGIKQEGTVVELSIHDNKIIIAKSKPDLKSLLRKVTSKNIHGETYT